MEAPRVIQVAQSRGEWRGGRGVEMKQDKKGPDLTGWGERPDLRILRC